MEKETRQALSGAREAMNGNLLLLREYARRVVAQGDKTLLELEDYKDNLMREYITQGKALKLTERDLVLLLFKGILD